MRFDFSEDRRLQQTQGPAGAPVATGNAYDRFGERTGKATAANPEGAMATQRGTEFNREKAAGAIAQALGITPEAASRIAQGLADIAAGSQKNNQDSAKKQWDEILRVLQTSVDANAGVKRSIEQTKAGFSGMCTVLAEVCTSFGWTEAATGLKDLATRLEPRDVYPDLTRLRELDPSTANSAEFTDKALEILTGDANYSMAMGDRAVDATRDTAQRAGEALGSVPVVPDVAGPAAAGGTRLTNEELNKKFDRALRAGEIKPEEARNARNIDANRDGMISFTERLSVPKALADKVGLPELNRQSQIVPRGPELTPGV